MTKIEDSLQKAGHEIAAAVRYTADKDRSLERQNEQRANARVQWATKLQEAGNLVLAGTVIAQVFAVEFNSEIAVVGVAIFMGAYLFAYILMKGGGRE